MPVAQPTHLLVFNESSGTSVTNYGTQGTAFVIQQGTSPTDYTWTPNATTPLLGIFTGKTKTTANLPYMTNVGTTPGAAMETINLGAAFTIRGFDTATNISYICCGAGAKKNMTLAVIAPTGGGDFDLKLFVRTDGGFGNDYTTGLTALTFGTTYYFAASLEYQGSNVMQARYKLGSNATQVPATESTGADTFTNANPQINVASVDAFTDHGGIDGDLLYLAYQRGGTFWSSSDLGSINADPAGFITGFPAGSAGPTATVAWVKA